MERRYEDTVAVFKASLVGGGSFLLPVASMFMTFTEGKSVKCFQKHEK